MKAKTLTLDDYRALLAQCEKALPTAGEKEKASLARRIDHIKTTIEVVSARGR